MLAGELISLVEASLLLLYVFRQLRWKVFSWWWTINEVGRYTGFSPIHKIIWGEMRGLLDGSPVSKGYRGQHLIPVALVSGH